MKLTAITRFKQGDLWNALRRLGWNQCELAQRSGLKPTTIGGVINLQRRPSERVANAIQFALAEAGEYVDVLTIWPDSFKGLEKGFKIEETREVELLGLENAMALMAPEQSEEMQERIETLQEAMQELPPRQREIIEEVMDGESNQAGYAKDIALRDLRRMMGKIKFRNDLVFVRPEGWMYREAKPAKKRGDLSELKLSNALFERLNEAGITTISELCERGVADVVGINMIGVKSLNEIITKLSDRGLSLAVADPWKKNVESYWLAKVKSYLERPLPTPPIKSRRPRSRREYRPPQPQPPPPRREDQPPSYVYVPNPNAPWWEQDLAWRDRLSCCRCGDINLMWRREEKGIRPWELLLCARCGEIMTLNDEMRVQTMIEMEIKTRWNEEKWRPLFELSQKIQDQRKRQVV